MVQFTWKTTGDRVFTGPDKSMGLLSCWPVKVLRTFKAAQKIDRIDDMEMFELQLLYYFLSVRAEDHTLLSLHQFQDLQLDEFRIADHVVTELDQDNDCAECGTRVTLPWHTGIELVEDPADGEDEVPPTNPTAPVDKSLLSPPAGTGSPDSTA